MNECLERFFVNMNKCAAELGMKKSNFASSHGMYNQYNYSSAHDMAKLCVQTMKIPQFREVVKTQYRECASSTYPGHIYKWTNTNKLLK